MFLRIKKSKNREYLLLVENYRDGSRHVQRIIKNFGRYDQVDITEVRRFMAQFPTFVHWDPARDTWRHVDGKHHVVQSSTPNPTWPGPAGADAEPE